MNLAVFVDVSSGWNVFELANVRDFKVLPSTKKGFLKLRLVRDTMDSDGKIGSEKSLMFINIQKAVEGTIEVEEQK